MPESNNNKIERREKVLHVTQEISTYFRPTRPPVLPTREATKYWH